MTLPSRLVIQRLPAAVGKAILLTFDDGPDPAVTPAVLDRLAAYGVQSVFFVVGRRAELAPHLLREILRRGHLIGNHTYDHFNGAQPRFHAYYQDIIRCQKFVERHTGTQPHLFRPPLGKLSVTALLAAKLQGLQTVMWSLESSDWQYRTPGDGQKVGNALVGALQPRDIVSLHDDTPAVLSVLDAILPAMASLQYDCRLAVQLLRSENNILRRPE